ncbi:alpha-L-arabinofuranosidase C-terminal domain-containing protein, partial [Bacteroides heparinolyticus]
GASDYDYNWTKVLMDRVGRGMHGLSLHYYTVTGWSGSKGSATQFDKDDYYWTLGKCREIEDVLKKHIAIMDEYDKQKHVALLLDEWGTWWDEEPGTVRGHLYQQNTLRDAFVASLSFDIFHKYTDRLKMANIAQIVNVLQSMILTKGKEMVLTPTYYVFKMYNVHQDATYIPLEGSCKIMNLEGERNQNRKLPLLSATASRDKSGKIHISMSNIDADQAQEVTINLSGTNAKKAVGEILTSSNLTDYNSFEKPDNVKLAPFKEVKVNKGVLKIKLPAKSIVTLELQ